MVRVARDEGGADRLAAFRADGDVLQVGVGGGEATRLRERLREGGVHASVWPKALRELVDIGRLELGAGTVFEYLADDGMVIRQLHERLLVRRVKPALRLLDALRAKAELPEEELGELQGRIEVEAAVAVTANLRRERANLAVERRAVRAQGRHVDVHAGGLHLHEDRHQRLLALLERLKRARLGGARTQHGIELERHVGVLGGVVEDLLRRHVGHRQLLLAARLLAHHRLVRNGVVAEELARKAVHAVPRGGVRHVVLQHRVAHRGTEHDAVSAEDGHVVLGVLRDQRLRGICERGGEMVQQRRCGLRGCEGKEVIGGCRRTCDRHVPGLPLLCGERDAHEVDRMRVRAGRLRVEREHGRGLQDSRQLARLLVRRHEAIVVRHVRELLVGRCRREGGVCAQEVLGKVVQLVLGADRRQPLAIRLLPRKRIERHVQRHVRTDRGEKLGHLRVLGAGGHLFGRLAFQVGGVRDQVLHRAVLREERGCRLLAHAPDAGNVVGSVTRERQPVDHLRGARKAPMLLHARLVVDVGILACATRPEEADVRRDELGGILVRRGKIDLVTLGRRTDGERTHHVVGLEALLSDHGQAQRLGQLKRIRDVGGEVFGHLFALRLVRRVGLVAERGSGRIHRQRGVRGLPVLENRDDPVREADERGGGDASGGDARVAEEHEMPAVEERHHVDDEERLLFGLVLFVGHLRLR